MTRKKFFSIVVLFLFINSINSKNLFNLDKQSLLNIFKSNIQKSENDIANHKNDVIDYRKLLKDVFAKYYKPCSEDLEKMDASYNNITTPPTASMLLTYTGLTFNDIEDEVECQAYYNSTYILVTNKIILENEDDKILINFLDLKYYTVTACGTEECKVPLLELANIFANFSSNNNKTGDSDNITNRDEKYPINKVFEIFVWIFFSYVLMKILVGIIRVIYIPKGYDICC